MNQTNPVCPLPRDQVLDRYFLEHRAKLIDVAAFLDRVDRAASEAAPEDFRLTAFRRAIALVADEQSHRAKRVLEVFSDHTSEMPQTAAGSKGATGAAPVESA